MTSPSLPKSVIFGCSGLSLTSEEKDFFEETQPLGFILFQRNCQNPSQISTLIHQLKKCVAHEYVPILIDQEGGRVQRLRPPIWPLYPPAHLFGKIADEDLELAKWCAETNAYLMAVELMNLGITLNCAPVLDLFHPSAHPLIGDRAFHHSPEIVASLALSVLRGFDKAGVTGVLKHIPGHGRALLDSHEALPCIGAPLEQLVEQDFLSFQRLCHQMTDETVTSPWAMTAHVIYEKIDPHFPVTHSPRVIETIIREHIGFEGFLITDCLTMKALSGCWKSRALGSLEAGCDAVLHCSGVLEEMQEVAEGCSPLTSEGVERLNASVSMVPPVPHESVEMLHHKLETHLSDYWSGECL